MQIDISIVITLLSVSSTGAFALGMLTTRFVAKADCEKCKAAIWDNIDGLKEVMMGGKVSFELRMVKADNQNNVQ